MKSTKAASTAVKLTAALAVLAPAALTGCSHTKQTPLANQTQAQYAGQQAKSAADYVAWVKTHGKPGQ